METYGSIEEIKYPQECNSDQPIVIILDDLNQKKWMIFEFRQCLNAVVTTTYQFLSSVSTILNLVKQSFVLMEMSITYLNLTVIEKFKISIEMKQVWIRRLMNKIIF